MVEADIRAFFDTIEHEKLIELLELRIDDKAFLRLIRKWLKAGILEPDGAVNYPEKGSAQGAIVSPLLANIYGRLFGRKGNVSRMTIDITSRWGLVS